MTNPPAAQSQTADTVAVNKAATRRLVEALNTGEPDLVSATIGDLVDPNVLIRTPLPTKAAGAAALTEVFLALCRAFPDLQITIEDLVAEEDKVVSRNSVTGTNLGDYMGRPATGRPVNYTEIFVVRFVHGRIAETWGVVDMLSQLRQLGAIAG